MFIVPLSVLTFDTCTFLDQTNPTHPLLDATINYQTTEMKVNDTLVAIVKGIGGEGVAVKKQGKREKNSMRWLILKLLYITYFLKK